MVIHALQHVGADWRVTNTRNQHAGGAAAAGKHHAVVRLFSPTLSDGEFTEAACAATERLRAAAAGDVAALARTKDEGKITALMVACRKRQFEAVDALAGSAVNAQSGSGCTALSLAAEEGDKRIVQLLLDRGAKTDVAATDGSVALHHASRWGYAQVKNSTRARNTPHIHPTRASS